MKKAKSKKNFKTFSKGFTRIVVGSTALMGGVLLTGCATDGKTVVDGASWHSGTATPTTENVTAHVGDFYLDEDDSIVYKLTEDGWVQVSNLKGQQGEEGDNGLTPYIDPVSKHWFIGETDTGVLAIGQEGKTPSIAVNDDGYWVLNEVVTDIKAECSFEEVTKHMENGDFVAKAGEFVEYYKPCDIVDVWTYTNSTFSGWGGSIGRPERINTIAFKVRARDEAITQIKVYLSKGDKRGEVIESKVLDVNIMPHEAEEVFWALESPITNTEDINYYFAYACNSLCDGYSIKEQSTKIPEGETLIPLAYFIDGKIPENLYDIMNTSGSGSYDFYLPVRIGRSKEAYYLKDSVIEKFLGKIDVNLADEYYLTANDNFQLFYRGVVEAVDPYNYHIEVECAKGANYPRYFEWTPEETDVNTTQELTIKVYDNNGNLLGSDITTLKVVVPNSTNDVQNVLCVGDSLTAGGVWVSEAYRRFTQTEGTPNGLGNDYLNFVGTVKKTVGDKEIGYEGYGGWTWQKYCSEASPFWDAEAGDISFKTYCESNSIGKLDVVYFLLTWNGQSGYNGEYDLESGHFYYAKKLIDKLHEEYPNVKVRCLGIQMPSQNGGMGANYGAKGDYSDAYGMLKNAMAYNETLEKFCKQTAYVNFVKYVDIAGQFDTDYNMPSQEKPVNNRNDETEVVGTNGVHPSNEGYLQIADAAFRSLCEMFAMDEATE